MTDLERIKKDVVEMDSRAKVLTKAVRLILEELTADRKTEPSDSEKPNNCEPKICDTCRYYNSNIPCGSTPSACKEADKFAEEFVDGLKKLKPTISKMEQVDKDINVRSKNEPQRDCFLCKWLGDVDVCGRCRNRNLFAEADTEPKPKDEPQTERSE